MSADKKSNQSQIAQATLDEPNQSVKVTIVANETSGTAGDVNVQSLNGYVVATGAGNVSTGTQRVVIASNQPTIPVDIQDTEIAVSLDKDEDSITIYAPNGNTTPIPVDIQNATVNLDVNLDRTNDSVTIYTPETSPGVFANLPVDVAEFPASLSVTGSGVGTTALRVQLADESLSALENINVTVTNTALEITNDAGSQIPVSGTVTANTGLLQPLTNSELRAAAVAISASSLPLPAGAATETTLSNLNTKVTTTLNGIKVDNSGVTQPVSGSVSITGTASVSVTNFPLVQNVSATNLDIRDLTSSDVVTVTGGIGQTSDVKVSLDGEQVEISNFPAVQAVSGTVSVDSFPDPLNVIGAGTATTALRVQLADESLSALENISVTVTNTALEITNDAGNPIPVSGTVTANTGLLQPLTNTELRASAVEVSSTTLTSIDGKLNSLGQKTMSASVPVVISSDQSPIPVSGSFSATVTSNAAIDVLGTTITGARNNQIEVSFNTAPGITLITNTVSGGGSVTHTNGHALYSTGTAVTASVKGVSVQKTEYRPAHEIYSFFTAAFTTPTSANSYQRIGLFDANNGFFIGYEGLTFGLTKRTNGIDTFIPSSSFNSDLLAGGLSSNFKRNGVSEAINYTFSNLFRVRFAWLGSASILFEVFSPDGNWVTFHAIKQPNTNVNPSIYNPDLPMSIEVVKNSSDATNLTVYTACWAAGTTSELDNLTATLNDNSLAALTRSVITGQTSAGGGGYVNVKVTPSGSLTTAIGDITGIVGQNTMANSVPVVIASNQSTLPISGTVTANLGTIGNVATETTLSSLNTKVTTTANGIKVDGSAVTQPVSATSLPLPTGAATSAKQPALGTAGTPSADVLTVQGAASMTALKVDGSAVTQPVSGSVSVNNFPATQTVSGTVTANAGTGNFTVVQATAANLNATVTGTVAATQSGTWNITNITGTVSLPTGASTLAAQNTGNASLSSIDSKLNTLGQKTSVASVPVVIASDQVVFISPVIKQTYAAGITNLNGTGALLATAPTDIATITGSATKVVKVRRIHISGIATNGAQIDVFLIKRSTANTGGTSVTVTNVPYDSLNAAATATVRYYGAAAAPTNPTVGTAVGTISQSMLFLSPLTSSNNNPVSGGNTVQIDFDGDDRQPLTLRGVNEVLAINLNGVTVPAGTNLEIDWEWTEE